MHHPQVGSIEAIKFAAKKRTRNNPCSHSEALEHYSRVHGFQNYQDAKRFFENFKSIQIYQDWFEDDIGFGVAKGWVHYDAVLDNPLDARFRKGMRVPLKKVRNKLRYKVAYEHSSRVTAESFVQQALREIQFSLATMLHPCGNRRLQGGRKVYRADLISPPWADHGMTWECRLSDQVVLSEEPYPSRLEAFTFDERRRLAKQLGYELIEPDWSIYGHDTRLTLLSPKLGGVPSFVLEDLLRRLGEPIVLHS